MSVVSVIIKIGAVFRIVNKQTFNIILHSGVLVAYFVIVFSKLEISNYSEGKWYLFGILRKSFMMLCNIRFVLEKMS